MNTKAVQNKSVSPATSAADIAKHAAAVLLLAAGVFAYYWFDGQWPSAVRVMSVVGGLAVALVLFMTTAKGAQTREFLAESRFELRKVVWPTRQEALQTTWVVMVAVVLISLLLAGFDVVIQWFVQWFLGR